MANITSATSTMSSDREKFLAASLLARSTIKLVCASVCEKVQQKKGTGLTAYFVRYARMNLPTTTLTEGTPPSSSSFALEEVTVTLDQWGDYVALTDLVQLTQAHPILEQAMDLLADNAARVIDREVQIVWFAGTNVQYGDASVTTRATITTAMVMSSAILHKARVTMVQNGAPPRDGPATQDAKATNASGDFRGGRSYLAICGPQVLADVMATSTSFGSWVSVATYANQKALYNAEMGTWLGFRFVETNFIPRISLLGNTTAAVASAASFGSNTPTITAAAGGSGTLAQGTTYNWKVVRKDLTRGFAEEISIEHTTATTGAGGATQYFTFAFPSTAGYVFDLYFGSSTGDSNLKLHSSNNAASSTATVNAVPSSTTTAPANVNTTGTPTIHPVYIFSKDACKWVGLQNLSVKMSKPGATTSDPLDQIRTVGYKFAGKAVLLDQTRLLRLEVASTY